MQRSHTLNVMHVFGNFGPGGAEMGVARLIGSFPDDSVNHSVCSFKSEMVMQEHLPARTSCYSLQTDGRSRAAFVPLFRLLKRTETHIVHVNNLAPWFDAAMASKLAGCCCVQTFHGVEEGLTRFSPLKKALFQMTRTVTSSITAVSDSAADLMAELTKIDRDRIRVIPNGVDTDLFVPAQSLEHKVKLRNKIQLPSDCVLFGCVAALRPVKNHEGLLQAFSRALKESGHPAFMRNARLVLVGDGPLRPHLEALSRELDIEGHVLFMGRRNNVLDFLQAFDVFVLASHTEGLSYAVLEAMASGLPVIASRVGANPQLVKEGQEGFTVPNGNLLDQLSARIVFAAQNRDQMAAMGRKARQKVVKSYALRTMLEAYNDLYLDIVRNGSYSVFNYRSIA